MIRVIHNVAEMQRFADEARRDDKAIALVPTMGFLHEGHLSLIREAKQHGSEIVVSIFVNPTQFGPDEDLSAYPRAFEMDCQMAESAGATVIFSPDSNEEMYPEGYQTYVKLEELPNHLCGLSRPVHFRGVATVVTKLFNIVKPHAAVFGKKDFQQLLVIRRMARDLNFDVKVIGAPIVREPDGLAMSSRNAYLSQDQRKQATCLNQALRQAAEQVKSGVTKVGDLVNAAAALIREQPEAEIDYIEIRDPETLEPVSIVDRPILMALAVKIGKARLIDNMMLEPT